MEPAAKGTTPEIITEEIVAEAKEEAKKAPYKLRQKLQELEAVWGRASVQFFQSQRTEREVKRTVA